MIRHIGSGLWVALQRIYVVAKAGRTPEEMKVSGSKDDVELKMTSFLY